MNFENFNLESFENVDVPQVLEAVQNFLEGGYDSPEARELRAGLANSCPELGPEQARLLLPWVEGLAAHLRQAAGTPAQAPKAPAPKAPAPKGTFALPPAPPAPKIPFFA
jgi:hypothetical protein